MVWTLWLPWVEDWVRPLLHPTPTLVVTMGPPWPQIFL